MKQNVTFLFTDIEGSSRLWETLGERMSALLARHDALVRQLVVSHRGTVVKFIGDGVHAAFGDPHDALRCGVEVLIRAGQLKMDEVAGLKLRAGLHMGMCEARDGDFYGETVNRSSRIANAAHGGQFIVSDAVSGALNGDLHASDGEPISLRRLGRIRLRDLSGEETLHQVLHRGLQENFPPLRSLSQVPNNLPGQRTSFVGRHLELRSLAAHVGEHRLVTLVGTGGIGKTRLALQTCARIVDRFDDGVWVVELAGLGDASRLAEAVLAIWNLPVAPGSTAGETLCEYLAPRRALLLLDNCEHLIDACAQLADLVLRRAPNVRIVATSREPLDVDGELVYRIPGLPLPDPDFEGTLDALGEVEAVRLFVERARLQRPDWQIAGEEALPLATLCYRLDGIPLAIELAAARMRDLSLAEILRGVEDRFGFLVTGSRVAPPRHKTLAGLIDWSYRLLSPVEQRLFRQLAVFHGGISAEVASQACSDPQLPQQAVGDALAELADKSLLQPVGVHEYGGARYVMLETLRQFAADQLEQAGEREAIQRAHARSFSAWAAPIGDTLRRKSDAARVDALARDGENLQQALTCASLREDMAAEAMSLAASLAIYWQHCGGGRHGIELLRRALAHPDAATAGVNRVHAEYGVAVLSYLGAELDMAKRHGANAREAAIALGLAGQAARAQTIVAYSTYVSDGYAASLDIYRQSIEDCRVAGEHQMRLIALTNLAANAFHADDFSTAKAAWEEARRDNESIGAIRAAASIQQLRGMFALDAGRDDEALQAFEEFLKIVRDCGEAQREGVANFYLARALDRLGRGEEALAAFQRAIRNLADRRLTLELLNAMEAFAGMLSHHAQWEAACLVCAATASTRARMGYRPGDQATAARRAALAPAEAALDSHTVARVAGTGQVTPLAAVVEWIGAARAERDASGGFRLWLPATP